MIDIIKGYVNSITSLHMLKRKYICYLLDTNSYSIQQNDNLINIHNEAFNIKYNCSKEEVLEFTILDEVTKYINFKEFTNYFMSKLK